MEGDITAHNNGHVEFWLVGVDGKTRRANIKLRRGTDVFGAIFEFFYPRVTFRDISDHEVDVAVLMVEWEHPQIKFALHVG